MHNNFSSENFFDLHNFLYSDLFTSEIHVWDVVKKISPYLTSLFASGAIKGNYSENVFIHPSAFVDKTARIEGPTLILENVQIGFNALIHGNVILDNNVVVGTGAEVKNSVLLNTCKASHYNYVSDSLLGNGVRLGVGAVIVNKRVDRETIKIKVGKEKIDTGLIKFGSIIGDGSRVGANSVINPGTIIGKNSLVYPLESVFGLHAENEIIK